jgi:hypothetical protein
MTLFFEFVVLLFLFDAFRRIKKLSEEAKFVLNTKMIRMSLFSYASFVLSSILFYIGTLGKIENWFITTMIVLVEIFAASSQVILMIVVQEISQKKSTNPEILTKKQARSSSNLENSDSEEEERPSVEDFYKFMAASLKRTDQ